MTLPAPQLPLNGRPHKICAVLCFIQDGLYSLEGAGRESGLHIFFPSFFASHADYFSYEVLTISHMRNITHIS